MNVALYGPGNPSGGNPYSLPCVGQLLQHILGGATFEADSEATTETELIGLILLVGPNCRK